VNLDDAKNKFESWLKNDSISLTQKQLEKKRIRDELEARDNENKLLLHNRSE